MEDRITTGVIVIDEVHHNIHDGSSFVAAYRSGAVSSLDILVVTPTDNIPHFDVDVSVDGLTTLDVYEFPTVSANGAAIPIFNRNRNSSSAATMQAFSGPTVTDTGTLIDRLMIGSSHSTGGNINLTNEIDLAKGGKLYLLRFAGSTVQINARLLWYEEHIAVS